MIKLFHRLHIALGGAYGGESKVAFTCLTLVEEVEPFVVHVQPNRKERVLLSKGLLES